MQKVVGVSSVRVSLNEGLTVLDFKPSNTVSLARLREIIRNNGFVTREAKVVALGAVTASSNDLVFEVGETGERFLMFANANARSMAARTPLVVTATVDITDPKSMKMTVSSVGLP